MSAGRTKRINETADAIGLGGAAGEEVSQEVLPSLDGQLRRLLRQVITWPDQLLQPSR